MTVPDERVVKGESFNEPFKGSVEESEPTPYLRAHFYALSEVDFMRLNQSSPALVAVGATITSFSLSYLLPATVEFLIQPPDDRQPFPEVALFVGIGSLVVGLLILVLSLFASLERWRIKKRIRAHFKNNPSTLALR